MLKFHHCMNTYIRKHTWCIYLCRWEESNKNIVSEVIDSRGQASRALIHSNVYISIFNRYIFPTTCLCLSVNWLDRYLAYHVLSSSATAWVSKCSLRSAREKCTVYYRKLRDFFFLNKVYLSILLWRGIHPTKLIDYVVYLIWSNEFIIMNGIFGT